MIRPLFQALRFGVMAGSWTLGMVCPPIHPPTPITGTMLAVGLYRLRQGQFSEVYQPRRCRKCTRPGACEFFAVVHRSNFTTVRYPLTAGFIFAATSINDRFRYRTAGRSAERLRQFSCCVRTQRTFRIHRLGSFLPLAAMTSNGGSGPEADLPTRPAFGASHKSSL